MDDHAPPARVFLRPQGSPLPLGLAGLAVSSLVTAGLDLGWISVTQSHEVGLLLLLAVVPIQLLACAIAFPARDGAAASTVGLLAATWAAYGVSKLTGIPGSTSGALGLVLLMAAGLLVGGALSQNRAPAGLVIAVAAARFALAGVYELSRGAGWQDAAGAAGLVVAAGALSLFWFLVLEDERGRVALEREPGVRPRL